MRAVAEYSEIAAALWGLNVDGIVVTTFVIGGVLAGIAGGCSPSASSRSTSTWGSGRHRRVHGGRPGRDRSIGGAALGGFLLGLLQSVGPALLLTGIGVPSPFQLKDVVTFAVLVLVLIFRREGCWAPADRRRSDAGRAIDPNRAGRRIVSLFVAMTGLLAKVATINLIGTQVTGARVILMLSPFAAAYVAVRPRIVAGRIEEATTSSAARYGAVVGLAAGGLVAAALVFTTWYGVDRVREIFIQVDQALLDIVAFGKSMPVGALILTVGGVLMGAAGGAFRTLTPSVRRPIGTAVSVTLVAGLLQRIIPIALIQLGSRRPGSTVPRPVASPGSVRS